MMTQENTLARYEVLHELGRGATGAVYAARDHATGAVVALKTVDPALLNKSDPSSAGRFLKHARSARLLRHPNIVAIHDAGEAGGTAYVAMEMLEGESLRKILDRGPLPIAHAVRIARDIACALGHAHLEGVVHGALKPSNVIVLRSGAAKITDFGIGQLGQAALAPAARAGCLRYLSPEQLRGDPIDHRCDIFSLGVLLYEMLAHRPPFEGGSPQEILEKILHARPPLPSALNPHVPRAVDRIVFSMLAAQPAARVPGAPILLRELQGLEEGLGLGSGARAGSDEPAACTPPPAPKARPRTPEPSRFREPAPMPDAPRQDVPRRVRTRADSPAAEEFRPRDRMADRDAFDYQMAMMEREFRRERSSASRPAIFASLALVLAVVGIGAAGFMYYSSRTGERSIAAAHMPQAPASALAKAIEEPPTEPAAPQAMPPDPMPPDPMPPEPLATEQEAPAPAPPASLPAAPAASSPAAPAPAPTPVAEAEAEASEEVASAPPAPPPAALPRTESSVAPVSQRAASAGAAPAQERRPATRATAKAAEQQPRATARLVFAVSPRGEIYIDGKHHGTTPPITTFDLEPGMHRIEVRSGSRRPYLTYVTVEAGDVRRIRHDFDVSRAVHPPRSASWQNSRRAAR